MGKIGIGVMLLAYFFYILDFFVENRTKSNVKQMGKMWGFLPQKRVASSQSKPKQTKPDLNLIRGLFSIKSPLRFVA